MSLVDILNSYTDEYWDFKTSKNEGIHKIANYPAAMVAPMQRELLQLLVNENKNYRSMLDPFHGSGVTLVEGQEVGLEVFGIDINPYAHIISLAKLEKYDPQLVESANTNILRSIAELKENGGWEPHSFDNISKWFRKDIIGDLSVLRTAIKREQNATIRRYYWLCFGEIVKNIVIQELPHLSYILKSKRRLMAWKIMS